MTDSDADVTTDDHGPDSEPGLCRECGEPLDTYGPDWCREHVAANAALPVVDLKKD